MRKWRFIYSWWYLVSHDFMIIEADTEEEAYKSFSSNFGYEEVDIISCEEIK